MGKGKGGGVKVIKVKNDVPDIDDITLLFNQLTGTSCPERGILLPKFFKMMCNLTKYKKILTIFIGMKLQQNVLSNQPDIIDEMETFIKQIEEIEYFEEVNNYDVALMESKTGILELSDEKLFEKYKEMVECYAVKSIIISCNTLSYYKNQLNITNLSDRFIHENVEPSFKPLHFSDLDIKLMWEDITGIIKKFMLSFLSNLYTIGLEIYKISTSPNINIEYFSEKIIDALASLRKKIPRCDNAFNMIENSVKLLETNFDGYYKSSVEAENPSLLIENFIMDISVNQDVNPKVAGEFKKIVMYLRKNSENTNDPRAKKIFNMLNTNINLLDKELQKS